MNKIAVSCPLCSSKQSKLFDQRIFRGQQVTNRLCAVCGLVYQSPRMSENDLQAFYAEEYRQLYQGSAGPNAKDLAVQTGRARALLAFTSGALQADPPKRMLDIGSSAGLLLEAFQQSYGCQVVGVEPGDAYRESAQGKSLAVYATLDELRQHESERFNLVSMAHVLEHIPDPVGYLSSLRQELLSPQGWLLVEVPNLYAHDSFEVAHLVAYSAHTLTQVLHKSGYSIPHIAAHGLPRSTVIPLYLTALARPADPAQPYQLNAESSVAIKRRLGLLRRELLTRLAPRRAWLPPQ